MGILSDYDPTETQEWVDSLRAVLQYAGPDRARFLLGKLRFNALNPDIKVIADRGAYRFDKAESPKQPVRIREKIRPGDVVRGEQIRSRGSGRGQLRRIRGNILRDDRGRADDDSDNRSAQNPEKYRKSHLFWLRHMKFGGRSIIKREYCQASVNY